MLNQIKALLSDAQLRQQIKKAATMTEAIALMKTVGRERGYQFSNDDISQLLQSQSKSLKQLDEQELLMIAGGVLIPKTLEPGCSVVAC